MKDILMYTPIYDKQYIISLHGLQLLVEKYEEWKFVQPNQELINKTIVLKPTNNRSSFRQNGWSLVIGS